MSLVFVISPPRAGSTLLQRMMGAHAEIFTHPEPHLITPIAHLGVYDNVDKAPYDHINAAEATKAFIAGLAGWRAGLSRCASRVHRHALRPHAVHERQQLLPRQDASQRARASVPPAALSRTRSTSCSPGTRWRSSAPMRTASSTETGVKPMRSTRFSSATCPPWRRSSGSARFLCCTSHTKIW